MHLMLAAARRVARAKGLPLHRLARPLASSSSSSSSRAGAGGGDDDDAFAARAARDGPVDLVEEAAVGGGAGSWYAPASVEARLGRKRNKQPGVGRTRPGPSEEDAWMAAGAPGYADVDRSTEAVLAAEARAGADGGAAAVGAAGAGGAVPAAPPLPSPLPSPQQHQQQPKKKKGGWAAAMEDAMGSEGSSVVRVSQARVPFSGLPSFVQAYRLLALPALLAQPGCVSARLLVSRRTDQDMEREADAALEARNAAATDVATGAAAGTSGAAPSRKGFGGGSAGETSVSVTAISEWESAEAMGAAGRDPAYASAMRQLSTFMRGNPSGADMNEAVVMDKRTGKGTAGGNGETGPSLGLH